MDFSDLSLTLGRLCLHFCELCMDMLTVLWEADLCHHVGEEKLAN